MKARLQRTRKANEGEEINDMKTTTEPTDDALDAASFDDDATVRYAASDLKARDDDATDRYDDATDRTDVRRRAKQPADDADVTEPRAKKQTSKSGKAPRAHVDTFDAIDADLDVNLDVDTWDTSHDAIDGNSVEMRSEGASVTTVEYQAGLARNPAVESLWFRLSDPDFVTTALVPVPAVTSVEANDTAIELAKVGASITGKPVNVVTAVGLRPGEAAETSRNIAESGGSQTIVVVESPGVDPSSIPILRSCPRVVLLVGLERSRADALAGIAGLVGVDRVVGSVCLERDKKRRWWHLRRR